MENYKESCCLLLHKAAEKYKNLLGKDFIIESKDFKNRKRYILRFYEGNFLHLTVFLNDIHQYDKMINNIIDVRNHNVLIPSYSF